MRQIRTKFFAHIRRRKNKKPDHHWKNQEVGGGGRQKGWADQTDTVSAGQYAVLPSLMQWRISYSVQA